MLYIKAVLLILATAWLIAHLRHTHIFTNLAIFSFYAVIRLIPPWRWSHYWRLVQADHLALVRKSVWELKCQGRVHEDREGRLWSKRP